MEHMISFNVRTDGPEDFAQTFGDVTELIRKLGERSKHVSVSTNIVHESDDSLEIIDEEDSLFHDENTMLRVREAIMSNGLSDLTATTVINNLQNAGILFRERLPL